MSSPFIISMFCIEHRTQMEKCGFELFKTFPEKILIFDDSVLIGSGIERGFVMTV